MSLLEITSRVRRLGKISLRAVVALGSLIFLIAIYAWAIETNKVEIGRNSVYDGTVAIERDALGRMTFYDNEITTPTTLAALTQGADSHAALTGLGADDHTQYLNAARHAPVHDATFNDAMTIGPDVAGNTSIGAHAGDNSIHLDRAAAETIGGNWIFTGRPEARNDLLFTDGGVAGPVDLIFEDGAADAMLSWAPSPSARFVFNRDLQVGSADAGVDPLIAFDGETNDGSLTYMEDEDRLDWDGSFLVDATTFFVDAAANRVGVGAASPSTRLHVAGGDVRFDDNTATLPFYWDHDATNGPMLYIGDTEPEAMIENSAIEISTSSDQRYGLQAIQYSTGAPGGTLQLGRSNTVSIGTSALVTDNQTLGDIYFVGADGGDMRTPGALIRASVDGTAASNIMPTELKFFTNGGSASVTQRMVISPAGNVGVGVTAPTSLLHVGGDVVFGAGAAGVDYSLRFDGETNDGLITWLEDENALQSSDTIIVSRANPSIQLDSTAQANNWSLQSLDSNNDIRLIVAGSVRWLLEEAGNMGIGTSTPVSKLHVAGDVTVGAGAAGVDYNLLFDGESSNGGFTWMEDEARLDFDSSAAFAQDVYVGDDDAIPAGWLFAAENSAAGPNDAKIGIIAGNSGRSLIYFGDAGDNEAASFGFDHATGGWLLSGGTSNLGMTDAATNSIAELLSVGHNSTGTVANGFGGRITYQLENPGGTQDVDAVFADALWTDAAAGDAAWDLWTRSAGTMTKQLRVTDAGDVEVTGEVDQNGTGTNTFAGLVRLDDGALGANGTATGAGDLYVEDDAEIDGALDVGGNATIQGRFATGSGTQTVTANNTTLDTAKSWLLITSDGTYTGTKLDKTGAVDGQEITIFNTGDFTNSASLAHDAAGGGSNAKTLGAGNVVWGSNTNHTAHKFKYYTATGFWYQLW